MSANATESEILAAWHRGLGVRGIARLLHTSSSGIKVTLNRHGITPVTGRPRTRSLNHAAFSIVTDESAYWMGFLFADGCIADYGDGQPQIILDLAIIDQLHVEKFRTFLSSTHAISIVSHKSRILNGKTVVAGYNAAFRCRSSQIVSDLRRHGMGHKNKDRRPLNGLEHSINFWRGAIDGDGTVTVVKDTKGHRYPFIMLCGHMPIISSFQEFLKSRGIVANITHQKRGNIFAIRIWGTVATRLIHMLYANATTALARKLSSARDILSKY